jgi:hypothetical protein
MTAACGQPRRWSVWLTHHQLEVYIFFAVGATLNQMFDNMFAVGLLSTAFVGLCAVCVALIRHNAVLCERCIADFPVDGDAQAEKHNLSLAYTHNINNMLWRAAIYWFAALIIGSAWPILTGLPWVVICLDLRARMLHRRLEPWCPWCRNDDDWDVSVETPVPTGEATR